MDTPKVQNLKKQNIDTSLKPVQKKHLEDLQTFETWLYGENYGDMYNTIMKLPDDKAWWIMGIDFGTLTDGGGGIDPRPLYMTANPKKYGQFLIKDWMKFTFSSRNFLWDPTKEQRKEIVKQVQKLTKTDEEEENQKGVNIGNCSIAAYYLISEWDLEKGELENYLKQISNPDYILEQGEDLFWPVHRNRLLSRLVANPIKANEQPRLKVLPVEMAIH